MNMLEDMVRVAYLTPNAKVKSTMLTGIKDILNDEIFRHKSTYDVVQSALNTARNLIKRVGNSKMFLFLAKTSQAFRGFVKSHAGQLDMDAIRKVTPEFAWEMVEEQLQGSRGIKIILGLNLAFIAATLLSTGGVGYLLYKKFKKKRPSEIASDAQKNPSEVKDLAEKLISPDGSINPNNISDSDLNFT